MDEFVKSVVEHMLGTGGKPETVEPQQNINEQTIYRPNYQRNKRGVQPIQQSVFYCVDTEPENKEWLGTEETSNSLEEDLRWMRLHAKEV